jgi:hypothetical protein
MEERLNVAKAAQINLSFKADTNTSKKQLRC